MRTISEIRQEIDATIGMDVIVTAVDTAIVNGRASLARTLAADLATQLSASTALTPLEIHTAAMTLLMEKMYDGHTNIHTLIPREIVDAVDGVLNP